MRVTMRFPAPPGRWWLDQGLAGCMVGRTVPFAIEEDPVGMATVVAAEVVEQGAAANLTLELPDDPRLPDVTGLEAM